MLGSIDAICEMLQREREKPWWTEVHVVGRTTKVKRWINLPPPYTMGSVAANRAGLQVTRAAYEGARHTLLGARSSSRRGDLAEHVTTLDRDGVVAIPNFFHPADFARVLDAIELLEQSPIVVDHEPICDDPHDDHAGLRWRNAVIRNGQPDGGSFVESLLGLVARDPRIRDLASSGMHSRVAYEPELAFEELNLDHGSDDEACNLLVLHADRHFPTVKMFLYLNRNGEDEGAFEYCKGSHRLSLDRLRFEYEYSIHCALQRAGRSAEIPSRAFDKGRISVPHEHWRRLGLDPEPITGGPNTLVVTNNRGFHRRGKMKPGHTRRQIRVVFHNLRQPVLGRLAAAAIHPGSRGQSRPAGLLGGAAGA